MLTGRKLFESQDDLELSQRVLHDVPAHPSALLAHPLPARLDWLVTSCLEKRREDRPQSAAELLEALDALALELRWTQAEAAAWRASTAAADAAA